ncbi:MAG: Nit6803 family nitriliase [Myxococcales bacterium]|nr:MAG: Nit6803 family nitriliase [Myxococcales bacterium]
MPRKVRAAAVQLSPVLFSREGTTSKVCDKIAEAAAQGAELVVFPETVVPYYPYFSFIKAPALIGAEHLLLMEEAVVVPGPSTEAISQAARRAGAVVSIGVNERDHGTLYNTQLLFDADGRLVQARRKITPTYHERMIWGQGDGSGLRAVDTRVGRVGSLACWEHYNPLARYALMADHEEIHVAAFPGSLVGDIFREQIEVTIRHHALESGCFVVNATGFLTEEQVALVAGDTKLERALRGGCFTAIVSPEGTLLAPPLTEGEGMVIADLDLALLAKRKRMMDSVGHYSRPELLSVLIDRRSQPHLHDKKTALNAIGTSHEPLPAAPDSHHEDDSTPPAYS